MPGARKSKRGKKGGKSKTVLSKDANSHLMDIDDNHTFSFEKGEVVWAKMKFFSAWPSKVCIPLHFDITDIGQGIVFCIG